jgi:hypothetical protein
MSSVPPPYASSSNASRADARRIAGADRSIPGQGGGQVCGRRTIFEGHDGCFAVIVEAVGIAVGEARRDLSQIARPNRLAAQRTDGLAARRPAIDQDKSHGGYS